MIKRTLLFFLLVSLSITVLSFIKDSKEPGNKQQKVIKTIVIDPGHGGSDAGARGQYSYEKDICLAVSLKVGAMIEKEFPGYGNHQPKGDICRGRAEYIGCISHRDAQAGGLGDIDIVVAHGKLGNHFKVPACIQKIGVDLILPEAEKDIGLFSLEDQLVLLHRPFFRPDFHLKAFLTQ